MRRNHSQIPDTRGWNVAWKRVVAPEILLQQLRSAVQRGAGAEQMNRLLGLLDLLVSGDRPFRGRGHSFEAERAAAALRQLDRARIEALCSTTLNPGMRIPGLLAACDELHEVLEEAAVTQGLKHRRHAHQLIHCHANSIREALKGKHPGDYLFSKKTFRAIQWLFYLDDPENFPLHLGALATTRDFFLQLFEKHSHGKRYRQRKLTIRLFPGSALFRANTRNGKLQFTLNEGFVKAPEAVLQAVARTALRLDSDGDRHLMRTYCSSDVYLEVSKSLLQQPQPGCPEQGLFFNLTDIYERYVKKHLQGDVEVPALRWMERNSYRTYGVYQAASNTVRISPALDHPDVPPFVLGFVLFHELVHARVGTRVRNGRRQIHSRKFYAVEKSYPSHGEASSYLHELTMKAA